MRKNPQVTILLNEESDRHGETENNLFNAVYNDLKAIASNQLSGEYNQSDFSPTVLVHEAYLKLNHSDYQPWNNKRHYYNTVARAMRRIIIDAARKRSAGKRHNENGVQELNENMVLGDINPLDISILHNALAELEGFDSELAELVNMRVFLGLGNREIGSLLNWSERKVLRKWKIARAWIGARII